MSGDRTPWTSGKWSKDHSYSEIEIYGGSDGRTEICRIDLSGEGISPQEFSEGCADAELISLAPEMAEALLKAVEAEDSDSAPCSLAYHHIVDVVDKLRGIGGGNE